MGLCSYSKLVFNFYQTLVVDTVYSDDKEKDRKVKFMVAVAAINNKELTRCWLHFN